jgi:hypothetical protein
MLSVIAKMKVLRTPARTHTHINHLKTRELYGSPLDTKPIDPGLGGGVCPLSGCSHPIGLEKGPEI